MALPWFRMYAEFATDPLVQALAFDDQRHFAVLLCFKCSGLLDKKFEDRQTRLTVIRKSMGLDGKAWDEMRSRLQAVRLIDSELQPINWNKRQFLSDQDPTAAERKRNQRLREGHAHVTRDSRSGHAPQIQITDTDTDTEQKKKEAPPIPDGLDLKAWERWEAYRKAIKKPIRDVSREAAMRDMARLAGSQSEAVEHTIAKGWTGLRLPDFIAVNTPRKAARSADEIEAEERARGVA